VAMASFVACVFQPKSSRTAQSTRPLLEIGQTGRADSPNSVGGSSRARNR
jgi:hypothetical protein